MMAAAVAPFPRRARAAEVVVPKGKIVLAWHTNITARWLDPQQHDGTASPDNFLMALQDALIKNFRDAHYDHPALAERFELAEDAKTATFRLRPGIKFHDGTPVMPSDVKWSYEHYRGAWSEVLHENTQGVEIVDDHTVRFHFNAPFLDFPILLGTGNVSGGARKEPSSTRLGGRTSWGLCHGNATEHALRAKLAKRHAAATAPCHCVVASDRKIRSVDRETRWR
jgi:ABC-type transport system substrate-binding protein